MRLCQRCAAVESAREARCLANDAPCRCTSPSPCAECRMHDQYCECGDCFSVNTDEEHK